MSDLIDGWKKAQFDFIINSFELFFARDIARSTCILCFAILSVIATIVSILVQKEG